MEHISKTVRKNTCRQICTRYSKYKEWEKVFDSLPDIEDLRIIRYGVRGWIKHAPDMLCLALTKQLNIREDSDYYWECMEMVDAYWRGEVNEKDLINYLIWVSAEKP